MRSRWCGAGDYGIVAFGGSFRVEGIAGEILRRQRAKNATGPAMWAGPGRNSYRARAVYTTRTDKLHTRRR